MAISGLPVSDVVDVTVTITPAGASFPNLSTCLILGPSQIIDMNTRMREYTSITQVGEDFPSNTPEFGAAELWFGQKPTPQNVEIGAWAKTATHGQLWGAPLTGAEQLIAPWNAITTGALLISLDGIPYAVTGLNFAASANLNGVAAILQTALAGLLAGTTAIWNANYDSFVVTSPTTGVTSAVSFMAPPTAVGHYTFSGQPAANDTITVNGQLVTYVMGAPAANQIQIGSDEAHTIANTLNFLSTSLDADIVLMTYTVVGSVLYCVSKLTGTAGNAYTLAASSAEITPSGGTLSGGSGTDVSGMFGGAQADSGSYIVPGFPAESALAAVELFDARFSSQWYALDLVSAADADYEAVAGYIEGAANPPHYFGITTQEAGALVSTSTTDLPYILSQLDYDKTGIQYSGSTPHAMISALSRILTTNWDGSNTTITLFGKQEPGVVPETISQPQANALAAKNCNALVEYNNGSDFIQPGVSCSGNFIDTIIGLDWLVGEIQTNVFNLLTTSTTKIPQTDAGMNQINTAIQQALDQGVTNGLIAPGTWNAGGFGQLVQGAYLKKGYYIYQPPLSTQPENERAARISVPFQVAVKMAGAVQLVRIGVLVNL